MQTFKDLLDRLGAVQGVPFSELAHAHKIDWFPEANRNKGLAASIVETVLGVRANNRPEPDLTNLNLEIKTIPIRDVPRLATKNSQKGPRNEVAGYDIEVLEHTKITGLNHADVDDQEWSESTVYHKLRSILFVPVVKNDLWPPLRWHIRSPFVWMPSIEAEAALRKDYETVQHIIHTKRYNLLSAARPPKGPCFFLIPNTGAQTSADVTSVEGAAGQEKVKRRAWMLRDSFTKMVLAENMRYVLHGETMTGQPGAEKPSEPLGAVVKIRGGSQRSAPQQRLDDQKEGKIA